MSKALKSSGIGPVRLPRIATRLVRWQKQHGRHGLPWQGTRDPYRVWLSEIMLQQTQVSTVIPFYQRFLQAFPTVAELAQAPADQVMALWTGLGYYSRARHLHRCAGQVMREWGGVFPSRSEDLVRLAGIGPSTAAAIASICHGERVAIFDGNVQRVLARHSAYEGDLSWASSLKALRELAQSCLPPASSMAIYTQAIMDLGATVCTPRQPKCPVCPLAPDCQAKAQDRTAELPIKTRKLKRQSQSWWLLVMRHPQHGVWLERRPSSGIWAGLHCFPVYSSREDLVSSLPASWVEKMVEKPAQLHVLTHRDLHLHFCEVQTDLSDARSEHGQWILPSQAGQWGLPKPVIDHLCSVRGGASG